MLEPTWFATFVHKDVVLVGGIVLVKGYDVYPYKEGIFLPQ